MTILHTEFSLITIFSEFTKSSLSSEIFKFYICLPSSFFKHNYGLIYFCYIIIIIIIILLFLIDIFEFILAQEYKKWSGYHYAQTKKSDSPLKRGFKNRINK